MRIILTGGGTGGHVYPALAMARYIKNIEPESDIMFVGTRKGMESSIVPLSGFPLETITVRGLPRKLSPQLFKTFADLTRGGWEARNVLRKFRPEVVMGTGGYVCGPVVLWASLLGIPTLIHEQNVVPGVTNKILSKFASKVCLSFGASKKYFKNSEKTEVTGNPRASEVMGCTRKEGIKYLGLNPKKATVLIVGGSRGAEVINQNALKMLPYLKKLSKAQFVYVTGQGYYDRVVESVKKTGGNGLDNIIIKPYLEEMPLALSAADLIISRAGATTLAEITVLGIPSILIPSPNVTNNHQYLNAQVLSEAGAAELINEKDLTPSLLRDKITGLIENKKILYEMSLCTERLSYPDSSRTIFRLLKDIIR